MLAPASAVKCVPSCLVVVSVRLGCTSHTNTQTCSAFALLNRDPECYGDVLQVQAAKTAKEQAASELAAVKAVAARAQQQAETKAAQAARLETALSAQVPSSPSSLLIELQQ